MFFQPCQIALNRSAAGAGERLPVLAEDAPVDVVDVALVVEGRGDAFSLDYR